jgi:hypothetical protein
MNHGMMTCSSFSRVVSGGEHFAPLPFGGGVPLWSLGKLDLKTYAKVLRKSDIGVSLILSPHPSSPPLETAAAGLVTITNRFANKASLDEVADSLLRHLDGQQDRAWASSEA